MEYKVIRKTKNKVVIEYGSVQFTVLNDTETLIKIENISESPVSVIIPHIFPTGHKVSTLSPNGFSEKVVQGPFNQVAISDHIDICCNAFSGANVQKVVWNDCNYIPSYCFYNSSLKEISNIDSVLEVKAAAFCRSSLKSIKWPTNCHEIPENCFLGSELSEIYNLQGVEIINSCAFRRTKLSSLDFSASNNISFNYGALSGIDSCEVIPPYYISSDAFENAMKCRYD